MSLPRLPFLYPQLFRSSRSWEPWATYPQLPSPKPPRRTTVFNSRSQQRQESTYTQRYGPAAEPIPPPPKEKTQEIDNRLPSAAKDTKSSKSTQQEKVVKDTKAGKDAEKTNPTTEKPAKDTNKTAEKGEKQTAVPAEVEGQVKSNKTTELAADEAHPVQQAQQTPLEEAAQNTSSQLEKVLHMDPPTVAKAEEKSTKPQMQAPPYVHHFDTYSLVKDLENGGFSQEASVTIMKSIRGMLAANLDMARDGLVSKSDVENETYLFRAACSELKTEITNSRKRAAESMRTDRAHLQHDVDILGQKVTQDTGALKDDLKGMFDDRKMATRMEQRSMESKIQELNYKITVDLVGDSKGEVEGLRWFLTRRAAMFIGGMALTVLGYLRYSSYVAHLEADERKRIYSGTSSGGGSGRGLSAAPTGAGSTDAVLTSMGDGKSEGGSDGLSYVSLG